MYWVNIMDNIFENAVKVSTYINKMILDKNYKDEFFKSIFNYGYGIDNNKDFSRTFYKNYDSTNKIAFKIIRFSYINNRNIEYKHYYNKKCNIVYQNTIEIDGILYENKVLYNEDDIFALRTIYSEEVLFHFLVLQQIQDIEFDDILVIQDLNLISSVLGIITPKFEFTFLL